MKPLPRDIQLKLLATRGWSIDDRRAHGLLPGKLQLPALRLDKPYLYYWRSPSGLATVSRLVTKLPSGREYRRERNTFRPLDDIYEQQEVVLGPGWSQILGKISLNGKQFSLDSKWLHD